MRSLLHIVFLTPFFFAAYSLPYYGRNEYVVSKMEYYVGLAVPSNPRFLQFAWEVVHQVNAMENKTMMPVRIMKVTKESRVLYIFEVEYGEANCANNTSGRVQISEAVLETDEEPEPSLLGSMKRTTHGQIKKRDVANSSGVRECVLRVDGFRDFYIVYVNTIAYYPEKMDIYVNGKSGHI